MIILGKFKVKGRSQLLSIRTYKKIDHLCLKNWIKKKKKRKNALRKSMFPPV